VAGVDMRQAGRIHASSDICQKNLLLPLDDGSRISGLCWTDLSPAHEDRSKRVKEVLEQVGLTQAASRRIGGYSRGMRQRLGLAQALINQRKCSFGRTDFRPRSHRRKEILDLISSLRGKCTVFMSTHILADVERFATPSVSSTREKCWLRLHNLNC